jgi:hypothetical protein
MHGTQKRYLSMFRRVRELLTTEAASPAIATPLAQLDGVIARLTEHGITQDTLQRRTRTCTVNLREQARALRRDLLRPTRLVARTVYPSVGNGVAPLRAAMRMPRPANDWEGLIVGAHAFANAADEHTSAFAAAGLPAGFAARIRGAADALVKVVDTRANEEQRRIAATRGLVAESRRGAALVRLLDALVEPTLRADPARWAEWRKATRVRAAISGRGAIELPDGTEASPAPALDPERAKLAA